MNHTTASSVSALPVSGPVVNLPPFVVTAAPVAAPAAPTMLSTATPTERLNRWLALAALVLALAYVARTPRPPSARA